MNVHRSLKFALALVFIFALAFMVGCAKKKAVSTPEDKAPAASVTAGEMSEEARMAAAKDLEEAKGVISRNRIYFDFDKFDLKPEAREVLKAKAALLKKYSDVRILIEGHCDERGTEEYNLALGERRARAAYEFLVLLGVKASQLEMVSYGEEYPADPGHNETAWAKNRRDEFKIIP